MSLKPVQILEGHTDRVWTLGWNPTGTVLASSGADKSIRLWAVNKGGWVCIAILTQAHDKSIRRLCWSPCGNYLASASFDATVCIWRKNSVDGSWSTIVNLEGHESEVKSVAWSSSGNFLASCGRDRTIWIWERVTTDDRDEDYIEDFDSAANWDCSDVKNDHTKDVKHIVWHPHHDILVSCSYDDSVKLFHKDVDDWKCFETLTAHTSTVWSADFSASGQYLATSSDDKTVRIWKNHSHNKLPNVESNSWKCVSVIQGYHIRSIYDVSWCKVNDLIVSASGDNSLVIYSRSSGEFQDGDIFTCVQRLTQAHSCDINSVAWNPKSPGLLASGGDDRKIQLWQYSTDEKGMKPLTIVDELMKSLSEASLKSNTSTTSHSKQPEEPKLTFSVSDFPNLLNLIKTLQKLQSEIQQDIEEYLLKKLIDLEFASERPKALRISGLNIDQRTCCVNEFCIDIINNGGEIEHKFKMVVDSTQFILHFPRRSIELIVAADELFLIEKTGDLFKILPSGQTCFLLGHLFMFSDVQFVLSIDGSKILFIISADRDEKIRISNYPETFDIERFCFGHKSFLKRIIVLNDKKFVSIDQKNEVCLWNLEKLKDTLLLDRPLDPERTLSLDESTNKRICTR